MCDSLEGQSYADEIRQQMISALGRSWQPATFDKPKEKAKKPLSSWLRRIGKLSAYSFLIAFFYDLSKIFPEITEYFSKFLP